MNAPANNRPTQAVLGNLYESVARVANLSEGLAMLIASEPNADCVLALANEIEEKLRSIQAVVHGLVEWA